MGAFCKVCLINQPDQTRVDDEKRDMLISLRPVSVVFHTTCHSVDTQTPTQQHYHTTGCTVQWCWYKAAFTKASCKPSSSSNSNIQQCVGHKCHRPHTTLHFPCLLQPHLGSCNIHDTLGHMLYHCCCHVFPAEFQLPEVVHNCTSRGLQLIKSVWLVAWLMIYITKDNVSRPDTYVLRQTAAPSQFVHSQTQSATIKQTANTAKIDQKFPK